MSSLRDVLYGYKERFAWTVNNAHAGLKEKGTWFEKLCRYFFKNDSFYKQRFEEVWLWHDWPNRGNMPDTGIDLVAKLKNADGYCAIQCKFYEPGYCVSKPDIDSFLAASGKSGFVERIVVSVADDWNKNAEDAIRNQQIPCSRLTIENLEKSSLDWGAFDPNNPDKVNYLPPKKLRDDQIKAIETVIEGFKTNDRGKLIMACGTGKTFTSLKIAEKIVGQGGVILFLVPSIALLNQTLLSWNADHDRNIPINSFAVCSDKTVGKEEEDLNTADLACPATTNPVELLRIWDAIPDEEKSKSMTVVFSTYQSLPVITEAQKSGLPDFNLVICDEAHRTAGVTLKDEEDSNFTKIHKNEYIRAKKRLYMTATPRLFKASQARKAAEVGAELCSMDDETKYGPEFFRLGFSEAVKLGLLSDYKVMILAVDEGFISDGITASESNSEIKLSDAAKIIGCWKGLSKKLSMTSDLDLMSVDPSPMRSAVAFSSSIKNSKMFRDNFARTVTAFDAKNSERLLKCEIHHVDGKDSVLKRNAEIAWLKESANAGENSAECRVLSNARCLSEGVDIPALDAILFLNPRKSDIDIVQSVGRVMRRAQGKKFGYVILPVVIPSDVTPDEALNDNENYKVVWQVLQALRAHDDNFNSIVNSLDLNKRSDKIITGVIGRPGTEGKNSSLSLPFPPEEWRDAVYVRIVQKCGDREYWDQWARDMAKIAQAHSTRLQSLLNSNKPEVKEAFENYLKGLRENINGSITQDDAIDMLSQHLITKPVFDAIFNQFSARNPISKTMDAVLKKLEDCGLESETEALKNFYDDVKKRIESVDNDAGRQKVIKDLYERFFQTAFPKTAQRLGIVYTPNEVVDFIMRSADWAVKNELNCSDGLSTENVHILDPFTGTGTFIVRLIQLGILSPEKLEYKYKNELHANEILLLAYYIATVNIEAAYHAAAKSDNSGEAFTPFPGIVLTDTFNLYDARQRKLDLTFSENSERAEKQRKTPITVIVGNPPYSVGQKSANDNNQNISYEALDAAITESYAAKSTATNKNSLYDSYIRAICWASDRIKGRGVICYVTNGAFLDSNAADGLRKCLYEEFQSIYIFNLRGNAYTQGEIRRKESGNVFGSGSRLPVAITLLVKNPDKAGQGCKLYYKDIGDYLTRDEKLRRIKEYQSFGDMSDMVEITPNDAGDWISKRSELFDEFFRLGNKDDRDAAAIFEERYSSGLTTGRDAWCYNFSAEALKKNMTSMIEVYNQERERWNKKGKGKSIREFVTLDAKKISWSRGLFNRASKNQIIKFSEKAIRESLYRPFVKEFAYFNEKLNEYVYSMPETFPNAQSENIVIYISGTGASKNFSTLMTNCLPNQHLLDTGQCFPLYWYEESQNPEDTQGRIFDNAGDIKNNKDLPDQKYIRRYAISDAALARFRSQYHDNRITHEDIFYYVYGVLSSPEYAEKFGDDVKKMLARVPFTKDFWAFTMAGRKLGDLHVNYEQAKSWPVKLIETPLSPGTKDAMHRVEKMKIVEVDGEKAIRYNENITITKIPPETWQYIVNGKSALEWIIERYQDSTDKVSSIRNDANAWGRENGNPRYILDLIEKVITVSVETVKILRDLPELGLEEQLQ